jgi:hypothetical protein
MWPSLVKFQYTELKLSCGNDPVVKNSGHRYYKYIFWRQGRFRMITLVLYIGSLTNLAAWFPCGRGRTLLILGSKVKVTVTINIFFGDRDPVVKNSIYSNGDLDLWSNDPKIYRVLTLPQGNHVAKFGKDLIYRTKVIVRKPVWTPARRGGRCKSEIGTGR